MGAPGDWDASDVLNPSVVRVKDLYYNFYSGYDGQNLAHPGSPPRKTAWLGQRGARVDRRTRLPGRAITSPPTARSCAPWRVSLIGTRAAACRASELARSADGRHWRKEPQPVVQVGPRGQLG